jgi:hypothetical protein
MFDDVDPYDEAPDDAALPASDAHESPAVGGAEAARLAVDADADATLRAMAAQQRTLNVVGWQQLESAAHWADLHGTLTCSPSTEGAGLGPGSSPGRRGGEMLAQRGGDGTPLVAEFAPAELGAVLGVSTVSAGMLMADALDLRHRLPLLWDGLQTGDVKVFVARKVAARTRRLSQETAALVDARVAPLAASVPYSRL